MNDMEFDYRESEELENVQNMVSMEIGRFLLTYWERNKIDVTSLVQDRSVRALQKIVRTLDESEDELDDFDCIEKIIEILSECGIDTCRHDY